MRFNVSAWSIRKPIPAIVAFAVLTILGLISFRTMSITRFPNIDIPIVQVPITQSGAAPSELELQVTKKVEDAVASVNGVWHVVSTVTDGSSSTIVQFTVGSVDVDRALNDVKDQIAKIRTDLPRTIDEPIISRIDIEGLPIVTYAASAPGLSVEQLSWLIDDKVARDLQSIHGVGEVKRFGGVDREIRVALDPEKLLALGVTAATVNEQVRADNVDLGGGRGELAGQEQAIRTLAGARKLEDLAALPIALPGGRRVRLDELATVTDGAAEPRTFTRLFDEPIVAFGVTRAKGASDVAVDALIAKRLEKIQAAHPEVKFTKVDTQVDSEVGNYHSTMETLIEGAALAIVVVFIFLRDLRATLVTAIALPLSVIPTFWAMDAIGFSLNLVSLLAITLVTGILVDDAIVEIENIVRHMRMGKSAYRASLEAADEIGLAVIAISLSIAAIFSPVSFMGGIAGQYFRQFGLTVAIAVMFSLLVARFVTPVMAAYFLRAPHEHTQRDGAVMRFYTRLVRASVRHRWITLFAGALIFAASLWSTQLLPSGFIPPDDYGRALLAIELPPGSRLDDTDRVTREISDKLRAMPEVRSALIFGGKLMGGTDDEPRKATIIINLVHKSKRASVAAGHAAEDWRASRRSAGHSLLVPQGQRPARPAAHHRRTRHQRHQRHRKPDRERDADDSGHRKSDFDRGARPAGIAHRAETSGRGRSWGVDRGVIRYDPRRHAWRHRRQSRQVQRGRSAGPDPGRARRGGARAPRAPARFARADERRRNDAVVRGCGLFDRPRTDRDQPLRSNAARDHRGRSARRRRARRVRSQRSTHCRPQRTCRRALKSARPATSRS